jgi:hypothetical protein
MVKWKRPPAGGVLFQRAQLALLQFLGLQALIVPSWAQVPGLQ